MKQIKIVQIISVFTLFLNGFARGFSYCEDRILDEFEDCDSQDIVSLHNALRQKVAKGEVPNQPQGSNLFYVTWDSQLQTAAQYIVNSCYYEYQHIQDRQFPTGQNQYTSISKDRIPGAEWEAVIKSWFSEHKNYTYGNKDYNRYTQMVWDAVYKIGCSYIEFLNDEGMYHKTYVCVYGPSGNCKGKHPYRIGKGCEELCDYEEEDICELTEFCDIDTYECEYVVSYNPPKPVRSARSAAARGAMYIPQYF